MTVEHAETVEKEGVPPGEKREQLVISLAENLANMFFIHAVEAKLLGGVAVFLTCPSVRTGPLARTYNDVDVIVSRKHAKKMADLFLSLDFEADRTFNVLYGDKRLLFRMNGIEVDVFVGTFEQCHKLDLRHRLSHSSVTLSPADLLLTKLQIIHINQKDLTDSVALLLDHTLSDSDDELNLDRITTLTGSDWGWYTTVSDNLEKLSDFADEILSDEQARRALDRVHVLLKRIEGQPKSLAWKIRSCIGRRIPWYVIPDEK